MTAVSVMPRAVPITETTPPASSVPPRIGPRNDGSMNSLPIAGVNDPVLAASMNPAAPASRPEIACTPMIRRSVGTPDSSAVRTLLPVTSVSRPIRVQL